MSDAATQTALPELEDNDSQWWSDDVTPVTIERARQALTVLSAKFSHLASMRCFTVFASQPHPYDLSVFEQTLEMCFWIVDLTSGVIDVYDTACSLTLTGKFGFHDVCVDTVTLWWTMPQDECCEANMPVAALSFVAESGEPQLVVFAASRITSI